MKRVIVILSLFIYFNNYSQNRTIHYLGKDILPYLFDSASNWVYENDSTHLKDSIIITKIVHDFEPVPHTDFVEYYNVSFKSSILKDTFIYHYKGVAIFHNIYGQCIYRGDLIIDFFDSIKIGSNKFFNVFVTKIDTNVKFYWVKNIGIIRKDSIVNNQTIIWNLISWNAKLIANGILRNFSNNKLKLYPNPCNDKIIFELETGNNSIYVYDIKGNGIYKIDDLNVNKYEFNTSKLLPGLYLIKVIYKNKSFTYKFIKE